MSLRIIPKLLLLFLFYSFCACQSSPKNSWELVWEDNFNREGFIDTTVWSKIPRGKSAWNNYMSSFDSCYKVHDGNLILSGLNNVSQLSDTAPYLTGGVYTKGKKAFAEGKLEIRAKLESATGAWPAIWLLCANEHYGKYPRNGEIDIMEHLNFDTLVYQTIHSHYTLNEGIKDNPVSGTTASIRPGDYNVYGVELYADSIVFSVNDKHTLTYPRISTDKEGQFPFDQPFYLLIDMQLGGSWVGAVNPEQLPVNMKIDWVRFYEKK